MDYKTEAPPPTDVLGAIPSGESIVWSGRPDLKSITFNAFGMKYVVVYLLFSFLFLVAKTGLNIGFMGLMAKFFPFLFSGALVCLIIFLFSYLQVRNTTYIVTEKRVVIKTGIALVFMLNVPFEKISEINRQILRDGSGNVSFKLISGKRVPFFASWPSVRPWHFNNPEPTFRCISDANLIAMKISKAATSKIHQKINLDTNPSLNYQNGAIA